MTILGWGHVPEAALAELADDPAARTRLSPTQARHLEACDRCTRLLEGHRRAAMILGAPWQYVGVAEPAGGFPMRRVRGGVGAGAAFATSGRSQLAGNAWFALAAALIVILAGLAVVAGARPTAVATGAIAFARGGSLYLADADGTHERELVAGTTDQYIFGIRWSPDHRNLAVVRSVGEFARELVIVTRDGRQLGTLDGGTEGTVHADWAPDGQRLASFSDARWDAVTIFGIDGRVLDTIELPVGYVLRADITWSPDGRWFAAGACKVGCYNRDANIMLIAADGSGWRWAVDGPGSHPVYDRFFAWAPDSRLALTQDCTGVYSCTDQAVVIVSPDGSMPMEFLLPDRLRPGEKAWAPDARRLAVNGLADVDGAGRLVILDDVGAAQIVDTADVQPIYFAWAPDGKGLLFTGALVGSNSPPSLWSKDLAGGPPTLLIADAYDFDIDGSP